MRKWMSLAVLALFGAFATADDKKGTVVEVSGLKATTPAGTPITTWKWLRAMLEHEAHHRGQLYLLLGLRGVKTPPIYGLTEEEVAARSASS